MALAVAGFVAVGASTSTQRVGASMTAVMYSSPAGERNRDRLRSQFRRLRDLWKAETLNVSSTTDLIMHSAYQRIIGLGAPAIAMILEELRNDPDHWDHALWAITGVDPVPGEARGNLQSVTNAWLAWARMTGFDV